MNTTIMDLNNIILKVDSSERYFLCIVMFAKHSTCVIDKVSNSYMYVVIVVLGGSYGSSSILIFYMHMG